MNERITRKDKRPRLTGVSLVVPNRYFFNISTTRFSLKQHGKALRNLKAGIMSWAVNTTFAALTPGNNLSLMTVTLSHYDNGIVLLMSSIVLGLFVSDNNWCSKVSFIKV